MFSARGIRLGAVLTALVVAFSMVSVDFAEARARGSFGSRGTRTFQSAPPTTTAPRTVAPVERSMTPTQPGQNASRTAQQAQPRSGFFNGFGGAMLRGLMFGGLLGLLFGGGFGGLGGLFSLLFQVLLIGGAVWLVMNLLRNRSMTPAANGPAGMSRTGYDPQPPKNPLSGLGSLGGAGRTDNSPRRSANPDELGISPKDLDAFETLLTDMQESYGREDYDALRRITTPEMMGYLAEQLGQNASQGVRNEVSDIKLLQGDVAESWREDTRDYATVAMRYELRDVTRDRNSGEIVEGNADALTEATELWTFVRDRGAPWKLSAIQDAST